jgi:hypothetical protein
MAGPGPAEFCGVVASHAGAAKECRPYNRFMIFFSPGEVEKPFGPAVTLFPSGQIVEAYDSVAPIVLPGCS